MEIEEVKISKQLMDNVRIVIENTKLFVDEEDFVNQAVVKQIAKYK